LHSSVEEISSAVEGYCRDAEFACLAGDSCSNHLALLNLCSALRFDVFILSRCGCNCLTVLVVDQLHIDIRIASEHGKTGLGCCTRADLPANSIADIPPS